VQRWLGLGLDPGRPGLTVGVGLDMWLAVKRRTKRESTCRGYEMHIRTWLKPQLGHLQLERLSAGHVEELFTTIQRINAEVRVSGRRHICRKACPPGCTEHGGNCPQFCAPDGTRHAKACPDKKGGWRFDRPKGKRGRAVPIPVQLVPTLRKHFADLDDERRAAGDAWEEWDLLWCQPNGRPIDPHVDREDWKGLLKAAGITKDARLHDARHTCGTLLGEQHVDRHVIQRILGHTQISTTRISARGPDRPANPRCRRPHRPHVVARLRRARLATRIDPRRLVAFVDGRQVEEPGTRGLLNLPKSVPGVPELWLTCGNASRNRGHPRSRCPRVPERGRGPRVDERPAALIDLAPVDEPRGHGHPEPAGKCPPSPPTRSELRKIPPITRAAPWDGCPRCPGGRPRDIKPQRLRRI
jgi:hypothetical protein